MYMCLHQVATICANNMAQNRGAGAVYACALRVAAHFARHTFSHIEAWATELVCIRVTYLDSCTRIPFLKDDPHAPCI